MDAKIRRAGVLLCCLAVGLSSCGALLVAGAGAGVGYGTYSYIEGNLKRDYMTSVPRVWEATLAAMDDLNVKVTEKQQDHFGGVVKGKMYDGSQIVIKLKRLSENSTEVGVRVGTFGDREKSEIIHNTITEMFEKQ